MLACDAVLIERHFAGVGIVIEVPHAKLGVLGRQFLLICLELQEFLAIDGSASSSTASPQQQIENCQSIEHELRQCRQARRLALARK